VGSEKGANHDIGSLEIAFSQEFDIYKAIPSLIDGTSCTNVREVPSKLAVGKSITPKNAYRCGIVRTAPGLDI
jgi:hypothetical protein